MPGLKAIADPLTRNGTDPGRFVARGRVGFAGSFSFLLRGHP